MRCATATGRLAAAKNACGSMGSLRQRKTLAVAWGERKMLAEAKEVLTISYCSNFKI